MTDLETERINIAARRFERLWLKAQGIPAHVVAFAILYVGEQLDDQFDQLRDQLSDLHEALMRRDQPAKEEEV